VNTWRSLLRWYWRRKLRRALHWLDLLDRLDAAGVDHEHQYFLICNPTYRRQMATGLLVMAEQRLEELAEKKFH